jgi:hypothetical protein
MAEEYASDKMAKFIESGNASFSEDDLFEFYKRNSNLPEEIRAEIGKMERKFLDEFYAKQKEKNSEDALRIQVIEELLSDLGGRMMRPYEHWNEEEHIREYMERDRDYE